MNSDRIWNLLGKFFSDEASDQEKKIINEWRSQSEENRQVFDFFQQIWVRETDTGPLDNLDIDKIWQQTQTKLAAKQPHSGKSPKQKDRAAKKDRILPLTPFRKVVKYAAAAVFLIGAVLLGIFLTTYQDDPFSQGLAYETKTGETLKVQLEDGSEIWLAPQTTLNLSGDFNNESRELRLQGEAYFSVQSDENKPFWVYTKKSITKVLGTRFNVMALPGENALEVLVTEGTVAVEKSIQDQEKKNADIVLKRGDLLKTEEDKAGYEVQNEVNMTSFLQWQQGIIHLDDLPLAKISERLERWYPVNITIQSDQLAEKRLTADFSSNQPLKEILETISLALSVEYRLDNQNVIFYE